MLEDSLPSERPLAELAFETSGPRLIIHVTSCEAGCVTESGRMRAFVPTAPPLIPPASNAMPDLDGSGSEASVRQRHTARGMP